MHQLEDVGSCSGASGVRLPSAQLPAVGAASYARGVATVTEQPPPCLGPCCEHHRTVGFQPCHCTAGRAGHRTYWCQNCRLEISVPVCWQKHRTALQNGLRFPGR